MNKYITLDKGNNGTVKKILFISSNTNDYNDSAALQFAVPQDFRNKIQTHWPGKNLLTELMGCWKIWSKLFRKTRTIHIYGASEFFSIDNMIG